MSCAKTAPDPARFPDPHSWATWIYDRQPQFKTHLTLGQCKNAISGRSRRETVTCDCYVFWWDNDACRWREQHFLAKDSQRKDSALYQAPAARGGLRSPSKKAVDAAINSILNG